MRKPCLDCGAIGDWTRGRCPTCASSKQRQRDAKRGTRQARGYDRTYEQARAQLLASKPMCHWCRIRPATTADHDPPLATLRQSGFPRLGGRPPQLVPSCAPCNFARNSRPRVG